MIITTGTRINHYEVVSLLGAGGMGEVYLAEDQRLGRRVAIKLLPTEFAGDSDRLRRFEQALTKARESWFVYRCTDARASTFRKCRSTLAHSHPVQPSSRQRS